MSFNTFKNSVLSEKNKILYFLFMIHLALGVKFSNLNEHKFRLGFNDTINPKCACRTEVETTDHFLLQCHFYSTLRLELYKNLEKIDSNF